MNPLALKTGDLMYIDNFEDQCLAPVSYGVEPPTHGILTPFPWYFDPRTYGILNPLPIGISNPQSMVYRTPNPWYIEPPAYLLIRNERVQNTIEVHLPYRGQFSIRGINIPWVNIDPWTIYHGGQNTI